MSDWVRITEVSPRDGLQNEAVFWPTDKKLALIDRLVKAGLSQIEVTAFVSPKWIPPLKDHEALAASLKKKPGVTYMALVPNLIGYEKARRFQLDKVSLVISVTQSHNQKNLNASTEEVLERYKAVIEQAKQDNIPFRVYLSCSFGCPFEGQVDPKSVLNLATYFEKLGAEEIAISDTIGVGNPKQTQHLIRLLLNKIPANKLALHLHDTHDMALANIFAATELEIRSFDASAGGLGGCPYAPGAKGNVATEKVVHMLHEMGFETGVDLEKL